MAATYKDIRRLTGLSLATISKYFNGGNVLTANRSLIDQAVRDLDYQVNDVARGLRSRRSMTLGVVLERLNSTFNTTVVASMDAALRAAGYATIICDARGSAAAEAEAVQFLLGKMVDGIIVVPVSGGSSGLAAALERELPVVAIDRPIPGVAADTVLLDNRAATAAAVELLTGVGHTELALLAGPEQIYTMAERRRGFSDAVAAKTGRMPRAELVAADQLSVGGGYDGMRRLMALDQPPTAVVCANYEFTLGATMALNELPGPRPAFVGFDNLDLARVIRPRPTIVVQPVEQIAQAAAELILERLAGKSQDGPRRVVLAPQLIVGDESTYAKERS